MSLLPDDACRVCFHGPHPVPCVEIAVDPGPNDEEVHSVFRESRFAVRYVPCGCREYVDLEAESRIVVKVTDEPS